MNTLTPETDAMEKYLFSMNGQMQTICVHIEDARKLELQRDKAFKAGKEQGDMEGFKRGFNEGRKQGMIEAAGIVVSYSPTVSRRKPISSFPEEVQAEIIAEERGESIAKVLLEQAILSSIK